MTLMINTGGAALPVLVMRFRYRSSVVQGIPVQTSDVEEVVETLIRDLCPRARKLQPRRSAAGHLCRIQTTICLTLRYLVGANTRRQELLLLIDVLRHSR